MKKIQLLFCCFWSLSGTLQSQTKLPTAIAKTPFTIGETVSFHSLVLNEVRVLNLFLPSSYYPDSSMKYPVIYLLDGSADEDFVHVAGLVQFGTFPWVDMLPESIVVGIANVDRRRDFTFPTTVAQDKLDFPTTGGSAQFIQFLETEVLPFIVHNYRTDGTRTIIGQSLGGLLATEVLFKKPELFDNYIIVSPSLWWDNESLLKLEPRILVIPKTVYLTVGKEEDAVMVRDADELAIKLKSQNRDDFDLTYKLFEGQNHASILHLAVYDAFERIYLKGK